MQHIGFDKRLNATIVDGIILLPFGILIQFIVGASPSVLIGKDIKNIYTDNIETIYIFGTAWISLILLYSLFEIFKSRTPGKMISKIIIRNQDGTTASKMTLFFRWAIKNSYLIFALILILTNNIFFLYISVTLQIIIYVGCLLMFTASKQALHDKIVKTAVFSTKST